MVNERIFKFFDFLNLVATNKFNKQPKKPTGVRCWTAVEYVYYSLNFKL